MAAPLANGPHLEADTIAAGNTLEAEVRDDTKRIAAFLKEYGAATGVFAIFAWMGDLAIEVVMVVVTFVFVAYVATVLFNRLGGIRRRRSRLSTWVSGVQSGSYAFALAMVAEYGSRYVEYIGIGGAALAGLGLALLVTAWRQRWREHRTHREDLLSAP